MTGLAGRNGTNLYRRATAPPPLPAGGRAVFRHRRSSAEARARQLGGSSKSCSQQQHTTLSRSTFVDLHQDEQKCGQMALPAWRRYRWLPPTLLPRPPEAFLTMTSLKLSSKTHGSMTTVFLLYFALLFSSGKINARPLCHKCIHPDKWGMFNFSCTHVSHWAATGD